MFPAKIGLPLCGAMTLLLLASPQPASSTAAPRGVVTAEISVTDEPNGEIIAFWKSMREWRPQEGRTAEVSNLVLVRDAAEFHLDRGTLTLLDFRGRTVGAVFLGDARVRIDPPLDVEREQLARYMEWSSPEVGAKRLFFLFADSTASELDAQADFVWGEASGKVRDAVGDAMGLLVGDHKGAVGVDLVSTFVNEESSDFFRAHIFPTKGRDLYFLYDGSAEEEVEFGWKASRGHFFEVLANFCRSDAYDAEGRLASPRWHIPRVDALHYNAQIRVTGQTDISAHAEVILVPNVPGGSWVASTLFYSLDVDSLRWGDGTPVVFDRSEDNVSALWLRLPDDATPGVPLTLQSWYRGNVIQQVPVGFYSLRTTSTWLPRFGNSEATYDLTFRSRKEWPVMSVGERVSREVDAEHGGEIVTRWVTTKPSSQVTFSVGNFEEYEFPSDKAPPVRIHVAERFHERFREITRNEARRTGGLVNILSQADPEQKVDLDVENSLAFFSDVFGPLDFKEFNVAEIPQSHGQAFPGMINLSWVTFRWTDADGFDEIFRAHEVAHQWWGIGVRPQTYHDTWLSEGLSEFSALWYMHRVRAGPQRYLDRLEDLRESILERRDEAGPIWLGPRVAIGREGGEDYVTTVYSKGAWVLHMLRNLMLDHRTGSEELFNGFMKELFIRFQNRTINTQEFQDLVTEFVGADMQWFFDQWVYGTDIPTYWFAYTTEELESGEVKMSVRIQQEGVPEDFMMPVPILLDFGSDGTAVVPILVKGREVVTDLPLLPKKPDGVSFNVLESVLAEVLTERW